MTHVFDAILSLSGVPAYAIVGTLAFLEAAVFVGLVLPGETAMVLGGVLASQGRVSLAVLLGVAVVAAVAGDSVGYEIGRHFGPALKGSRLGRMVGDARWARGEAYLARRGGSAVLLGRWVGLLRALAPAVAGMSRMPYRRFLAYNAAGGTVWAVAVVLLGYFAGASFRRVETYLGRASMLLLAVLLAGAALVLGARYVVRHRQQAVLAARRIRSTAPVRALEQMAATMLARLSRRTGDIPAFGAGVGIALVLLAVLAMAFAQLFDNILDGNGVAALDRPVLGWLASHRDGEATAAMLTLSTLGGPVLLPLLALTGAGLLRWRARSWAPVVIVVVTAAGSGTITLAGKHLVGRFRPALEYAIAGQQGFSFPSGHSLNSTAILGVLAVLAGRLTRSWAHRVWIATAAVALVGLIGLSRLYLGVHWLTDVLAAWLLGGMWLVAVLGAWRYSGMRRRHRDVEWTVDTVPAPDSGATAVPAPSSDRPV